MNEQKVTAGWLMAQRNRIAAYVYGRLTTSQRYVFGLVVVLMLMALLFVSAFVWFDDPESLSYKISASLAEALVVALVVGIVVEPYTRRRFVKEVSSDAIWAFINSESPADYKAAVGSLAAEKLIFDSCNWTLRFDWVDDTREYLYVTMTVSAQAQNYDRRPTGFAGESWLLASSEPHESSFSRWSMISTWPGNHINVNLDEASLVALTKVEDDGTLKLDRALLSGGKIVLPRQMFLHELASKMTRRASGYVPLGFGISSMPCGQPAEESRAPGSFWVEVTGLSVPGRCVVRSASSLPPSWSSARSQPWGCAS